MSLAFAYFKPKTEISGMLQLITHYCRLPEEVYKIVNFTLCKVKMALPPSQSHLFYLYYVLKQGPEK